MQPKNPNENRSRIRNHKGLAVAGATLLLAGAGSAGLAALADPVDSNIASSCAIGTSKMDVTVPLTVDDKVDPISAGAQETLETRTGFPTLPVEVTIDKLVVTEPIPEQIASTDSVTFTGGNVTGSYEISGSNLVVTFTGPVSSKDMQVPVVTAKQTLKDGIAPTTIEWKTFSQIVADTNYGQATCTPNDANQTVNTTSVVAAESTPTTSPTTTPPSSTPPTTSPTPTTTPPAGSPGLPAPIPDLPIPDLPVPAPGLPTPNLPAPPAVPALPAPPSLPTPPVPSLPAPPSVPGLPGGATGPCPALPVPVPVPAPPVPCPAVPAVPAPTLPAPPTLPVPTLPGASAEVGVQVKVGI